MKRKRERRIFFSLEDAVKRHYSVSTPVPVPLRAGIALVFSASYCECAPPVMTHYIMPVITFHENAFGDNCVKTGLFLLSFDAGSVLHGDSTTQHRRAQPELL